MSTLQLPPNRPIDHDHLSTSRAQALFALGIILPPLATFFVGVRLYSRHMKRAKYGVDDYLLVAALIFYYTLTACLFVMLYPGWNGHHTIAVPDPVSALTVSTQTDFYSTLSYALVATCIRCSTCMLFIRIFIQRWYRYAAYTNLGLNIAWGVYSVLITIFQCNPVRKALHPTVPGHCLSAEQLLLSLTIWGVICDAITWALPVPMVWQLHAPLSTKIGLTCILALGLVAIAIGGLRIWTVVTLSLTDPLWSLPLATYWAYTETGIGIICAAAASIAPVFQRFFVTPSIKAFRSLQSLVSSSRTSHSASSAGGGVSSGGFNYNSSEDRDSMSLDKEKYKDEWAQNHGAQGVSAVQVQALGKEDAAAYELHPDEVTLQTEISVSRDVDVERGEAGRF